MRLREQDATPPHTQNTCAMYPRETRRERIHRPLPQLPGDGDTPGLELSSVLRDDDAG